MGGLLHYSAQYVKNVLFEQEMIESWNKQHLVENNTQIMQHVLERPQPACLFRSTPAATLLEFRVPLTNYFVHRWFCVVRGLKPPLHHYNWLSFGKFQDTKRFLIPCQRHVSSRLPPNGETCKFATVPSIQKTWRDSLPIDILPFGVTIPATVPQRSEIPEGLKNYPVFSLK
jgi:hypothetical protein